MPFSHVENMVRQQRLFLTFIEREGDLDKIKDVTKTIAQVLMH